MELRWRLGRVLKCNFVYLEEGYGQVGENTKVTLVFSVLSLLVQFTFACCHFHFFLLFFF